MESIALQSPIRKRIRKRTLSERMETGLTATLFVMVAVICMLSLLFLSHSNKVATQGHVLKALQEQRSTLVTENEVLGMKIADLQSLENLENDPKIASMVNADTPKFIRGDTAIAKNQ